MTHATAWLLSGLLLTHGVAGQCAVEVDPRLPNYVPRAFDFPERASYLTAEKAVAVIGYNDMQEMLEALDVLFERAHPGVRFALTLKGTRTAPPALAAGACAFAPMGAEFSETELAAYRQTVDADPLAFRVAHDSLNPHARSAPLALYVSANNPLTMLTIEQAARIFTLRAAGDGIEAWSQLGLHGEWDRRGIHVYGLADNTALGSFMRIHRLGGQPYRSTFTGLPQSADVVRLVGADRSAIGFAALNLATPAVRVVPIAESRDREPSRGAVEDILAGRYPLDRYLLIYVRLLPDGQIDPIAREYLHLVLSREGQQAIAAGRLEYLPLNPVEVAAELAKLEAVSQPIPTSSPAPW